MGMCRTIVYVHVIDDLTAQTVLGKHTLYNLDEKGIVAGLDVLVERLLLEKLGGRHALAAGIAGVAEIFAVGPLVAGETNLVGVDDDYIVTTLYEGRVGGLVLAAKYHSDN